MAQRPKQGEWPLEPLLCIRAEREVALLFIAADMGSLDTDRILVVGAGAAGLITAHTFIQDGFRHVDIVTRDPTPGGIWSSVRVYPGLIIHK